jgi:hypothetical protein
MPEPALVLPGTRSNAGSRPARKDQRSAVTNGKRLHVVSPGDTKWARRWRDVLAEIVSDLGGADLLSEGQKQLARRCATIAIACEKMEGEAAQGCEIDLDAYGTLTDRLGRALQRLGLERKPRDVTPSLGELLAADQRQQRASRCDRRGLLRVMVGADAMTASMDIDRALAGTTVSSVARSAIWVPGPRGWSS